MLLPDDQVTGVDYDEELAVVVVRTKRKTNYEKKLKKKVQTSGCAQGTVFGDLMESAGKRFAAESHLAHLVALRAHAQDQHHSVALSRGRRPFTLRAGAGRPPLVYMEDVAATTRSTRSPAGCSRENLAPDKIFYTTGRLTSRNGDQVRAHGHSDPDLSRSGFNRLGRRAGAQGQLDADRAGARQALRRARRRGPHRVRPGLAAVEEESSKHRRKAAVHED